MQHQFITRYADNYPSVRAISVDNLLFDMYRNAQIRDVYCSIETKEAEHLKHAQIKPRKSTMLQNIRDRLVAICHGH